MKNNAEIQAEIHPEIQTTIEPQALRAAFGQYPTGVCIVTCRSREGVDLGMTISSVNSLSLTPPLILYSIKNTSRTLDMWKSAKGYALSVLSDTQAHISTRFATPSEDRWSGVAFERGYEDAPLIQGAVALFECKPHIQHDTGDHTLFIAEIVNLSVNSLLTPLVFCKGRYDALKSA